MTARLQDLVLVEPEELPQQLPFRPTGPNVDIQRNFDKIPRYLLRVSTPKSDGLTNQYWTKSWDARLGLSISCEDIFDLPKANAASMLNEHLRWSQGIRLDNLVSWTNSLLFAIQYMLYRHKKHEIAQKDIELYIIDTTKFSRRTFMNDMDLITTFSLPNFELQSFEELRNNSTPLVQAHITLANTCHKDRGS